MDFDDKKAFLRANLADKAMLAEGGTKWQSRKTSEIIIADLS